LPLPRQVLEAVGVEQRLVELAALTVVHLHERWVADAFSTRRLSAVATGRAYGEEILASESLQSAAYGG
jgi:hypothetical protein